MKCKDIMTRNPKSVTVSSTAMQTAHLMKNENIGIVPVVDEKSQKVVGVVTDRDLCLGVVAEGKNPSMTKVLEMMSGRVISCRPDDDIHKAELLMKEHQVRRITVVDQNGYCVGIISSGDLALRVDQPKEIYETVRGIAKPKKLITA
jgi:CBS domain-containing protein